VLESEKVKLEGNKAMPEDTFNGLYDKRLHVVHQMPGVGPAYTLGDLDKLKKIGESGKLRANMMVKAQRLRDGKTWMVPKEETYSLQEILDELPPYMSFGSIA
jgi:hypothetical protein